MVVVKNAGETASRGWVGRVSVSSVELHCPSCGASGVVSLPLAEAKARGAEGYDEMQGQLRDLSRSAYPQLAAAAEDLLRKQADEEAKRPSGALRSCPHCSAPVRRSEMKTMGELRRVSGRPPGKRPSGAANNTPDEYLTCPKCGHVGAPESFRRVGMAGAGVVAGADDPIARGAPKAGAATAKTLTKATARESDREVLRRVLADLSRNMRLARNHA